MAEDESSKMNEKRHFPIFYFDFLLCSYDGVDKCFWNCWIRTEYFVDTKEEEKHSIVNKRKTCDIFWTFCAFCRQVEGDDDTYDPVLTIGTVRDSDDESDEETIISVRKKYWPFLTTFFFFVSLLLVNKRILFLPVKLRKQQLPQPKKIPTDQRNKRGKKNRFWTFFWTKCYRYNDENAREEKSRVVGWCEVGWHSPASNNTKRWRTGACWFRKLLKLKKRRKTLLTYQRVIKVDGCKLTGCMKKH